MGKAQVIPPSKVPERQRGWGMLVRLLGNVLVNPIDIPLRRFAFAVRRCPPSKGQGLMSAHYPIILSKIISGHPIDNPFRECLIEYRFIA